MKRTAHLVPILVICLLEPATTMVAAQRGQVDYSNAVALEGDAYTSANASLGDLDGDGDLDIVLAKGRHWPLVDFVLLNDGAGNFDQRHEVGGSADRTYTAALADLDGDGDLDLVVGNDRPDDKRVYHNDGAGNFTLVGTFGDAEWPTRNITVADINGDGHPEIVVANRGGPQNLSANYVCFNDGKGTFPRCEAFSDQSATTIAAGDLDGDGHTDLFVPHRDGGQSYLYLNTGDGLADPRPVGPPSSATRAVTLGDVDGDGALDIVVGDERGGGTLVYRNRGDATFEKPYAVGGPDDLVFALAVADLDGDGDAEIVVGNAGGPSAVLVNDGSGRSYDVVRFADTGEQAAVYGVAIGDVNGDAIPDIVAGRSDAPNMLYLGCCR